MDELNAEVGAEQPQSEVVKPPISDNFKWYVCKVKNRYEKATRDELLKAIREENAETTFDEILVPTQKVLEIVNEKKKEVEKLFYPGYLFMHMVMSTENWHLVNGINGVFGFIDRDKPRPMTKSEVSKMLAKVDVAKTEGPKLKNVFTPGELVRIVEGPFKDFTGIVESISAQRNRIKVSIDIFGRTTPVEMEFNQVVRET